jgi:hypothetical protein
MKGNIVLGGLLGIALGAGAVFAFAHGLSPRDNVVEDPPTRIEAGQHEEQVSSEAVVVDVPRGAVRHRPLRPGSERIGSVFAPRSPLS